MDAGSGVTTSPPNGLQTGQHWVSSDVEILAGKMEADIYQQDGWNFQGQG